MLRELIDNEQQRTVALALQDSHAQFLVDFCQRVLDEDPLRMRKTPHDVPALRAMRKFLVDLSKQSGKLPSRLYIDGVSNKSDFAIDHGGFSDVYTAEYKNLKVALKLLHVAGDASVPIPDQKKVCIDCCWVSSGIYTLTDFDTRSNRLVSASSSPRTASHWTMAQSCSQVSPLCDPVAS